MKIIKLNADLVETGERIRERRVLLGISQETLAEAVGVTRNSISRYENGQTEMKLDVLYKICDFLKITPSDISPSRFRKVNEVDEEINEIAVMYKQLDKENRHIAFKTIKTLLESMIEIINNAIHK
ncbi:MAG: helix-turn-helix transcriptional regulator [Methanosphaera sp.]|nr:helix-turn-helix transcriptional regulator [Methanosphaera sp.]